VQLEMATVGPLPPGIRVFPQITRREGDCLELGWSPLSHFQDFGTPPALPQSFGGPKRIQSHGFIYRKENLHRHE